MQFCSYYFTAVPFPWIFTVKKQYYLIVSMLVKGHICPELNDILCFNDDSENVSDKLHVFY